MQHLTGFEKADTSKIDLIERGNEKWLVVGSGADKLELRIAPEGFAGGYCLHCNSFAKVGDLQVPLKTRTCANCSEKLRDDEVCTGIQQRDVDLVMDDEEVFRREWWHLSYSSEWGTNGPVHVGSLETALSRMGTLPSPYPDNMEPFESNVAYYIHLHRLKVVPNTPISSTLFRDNHLLQDHALQASKAGVMGYYELTAVNRYLNELENNGNVSLFAAHRKFFTLVDTLRFPIYKSYDHNAPPVLNWTFVAESGSAREPKD